MHVFYDPEQFLAMRCKLLWVRRLRFRATKMSQARPGSRSRTTHRLHGLFWTRLSDPRAHFGLDLVQLPWRRIFLCQRRVICQKQPRDCSAHCVSLMIWLNPIKSSQLRLCLKWVLALRSTIDCGVRLRRAKRVHLLSTTLTDRCR